MKRTKPNGKMKKLVQRIVAEEPGFARVAPLLIYQGDDLFKLELLASVLNDVPPDSPDRDIADLIERLVTTPPAQQEWVKLASPIIGPAPCTPAPGSPLDVLNKFLVTNPCVLQIEGLERADGNIKVNAIHIPIKLRRDRDRILWVLWEVFYSNIDLTRLKTCPICHKWFVDHSKNKTKIRCSAACTSKRWSWDARKKAGHHLPGSKANKKGKRDAKAKKA